MAVGREALVFIMPQGDCSCGAPADARLEVRHQRLSYGLGITTVEAKIEPQCYCCRACGKWALEHVRPS